MLLVSQNLIFLYNYNLLYFLNPFIFATKIFIICNTSSTNSSFGSLFSTSFIIVILPLEYLNIKSSISSYPNLHNLSLCTITTSSIFPYC